MSGLRTGRLFLSALRLDREPAVDVREGALSDLDAGVGGFLIFGGDAGRVRDLAGELVEGAGRPLWLAADLERGPGQQLHDLPALPPPAGLAAHPEPEGAARLAGRLTARGARRAGLNWVLAPVLDLDVEPANPIVGPRSFGPDPDLVGRLGRAWIEACQAEGVAACAKHFPGHGRTVADSHLELPTVTANREALEEDLRPFRRVADAVAAVMTAHVAYPELGSRGPATTSRTVVTDLLRRELGFEGTTVSDALIMEGFEEGTGAAVEGWRAVRALRAGCDLLLYPRDLAQSARTVRQAAESDPGLGERVLEALERSEAGLDRFAAAPVGQEDALAESAASEAGDAGRISEACVVSRGAAPDDRLDPSEALEVVEIDAGAAVGAGEASDGSLPPERSLSAAVVPQLRELGWTVPAEEGRAHQRLVLAQSVPRAWTGGTGPDEDLRRRIRAGTGGERSYLLFFGHVRHLESLGVAGACGWWPEQGLAEAAARWLDRAVRT